MATTTSPDLGSRERASGARSPRWALPVALAGCALLVAFGVVEVLVSGEAGHLVWPVVLSLVTLAVVVPFRLMERSGRGVAAPMATAETRWSTAGVATVLLVAAGGGAAWAFAAGHTAFGVSLLVAGPWR